MSSTDAASPFNTLAACVERASRHAGPILMMAALLALIVANSSFAPAYFAALAAPLAGMSVLHWINDGLMAVFFLLVGLEIKRELLVGALATRAQRVLPAAAALGGMIGPALIYLAVNKGAAGQPAGWAIPAATDIAFALGVLALLGSRVPTSLKLFLTALAIIDDLGAVLIIALFYSSQLNVWALCVALSLVAVLVVLNRRGVTALGVYLVLGAALWLSILKSGVHATVAGVVLALTIPLQTASGSAEAPLLKLEHALAPCVAVFIVPLFGFANAGVSFAGMSLATALQPVPLGVALGLFVGKQAGIMLAAACVIGMGWAALPAQANWRHLYGLSILCGIGFTMSLFIGLLAFPSSVELQNAVKVGVLVGSVGSAVVGAGVLMSGGRR
ncbi:MAG: Na+/H+ antiporter NhaA [Steroidobacteraceae bacterium]